MKIGLVQIEIPPETSLEGIHRAQEVAVTQVFADGARVVVLPECASHKYLMGSLSEVQDWAEPIAGPTVRLWERLAREHHGYIVAGMLEKAHDGLYNTAVIVGPQGCLGHYRKLHRFGWERKWLASGDGLTLFRIKSLDLALGVLICYDLRFEYTVEALARAGADLIVVPTTWTSIGKSVLWDHAGYAPQNHLVLGHAYAHRVFLACADRVGVEEDITYLGASLVAGPDGETLLGPFSGHARAAGVVDVEVSRARSKRVGQNDIERDRRWAADIPLMVIEVE